MIFNPKKAVGIVAYGAKIPKLKISGVAIAKVQGKSDQKIYKSLGIESKTVPGIDEDVITLSTAAGFQALERLRAQVGSTKFDISRKISQPLSRKTDAQKIGALFIGSESHPYAVKPSGSVVAQVLGIASDSILEPNNANIKPLAMADLQFACKAGTQSMQIGFLYVNSGFCDYAMTIGADTAQARPGDVLEYSAGAGAAAYILGCEEKTGSGQKSQKLLAKLIATTSVATDTPDFWRRPYQAYPEHAGRFTADPGYFAHIKMSAKLILDETGLAPGDFDYCVFHTPNAKFPTQVAHELGFSPLQIEASLLVTKIGNTYAGASMLGLASTLDIAQAGKKILVISYGSGSGSDAFIFETTKYLEVARKKWDENIWGTLGGSLGETLTEQLGKLTEVSYEEYMTNSTH
jgi:hydroxymethylglutaryl-CoA synthase